MGSHLGGGFVNAGETDNQSTTRLNSSQENPALATAITRLDAKAPVTVEGWSLLVTAVSWQTKVPAETLKKQRATTGLTYGQLLVANSLAAASGKSFDRILALRSTSPNWSQLAARLHINIESIVARLNTAGESIRYAEYRRKIRRAQNLKETEFQRRNNPGS